MEPLNANVITRLALYQVVALIYGVLGCASATRWYREAASQCHIDPTNSVVYCLAHEFSVLGWLLFLVILTWTAIASNSAAQENEDPILSEYLLPIGILFIALLVIIPTFWVLFLAPGPVAWDLLVYVGR